MRKAADHEESETERAWRREGETDEREPIGAWREEFDGLKPYGPMGRRKQKSERPAKSEDPNQLTDSGRVPQSDRGWCMYWIAVTG